MTDDVPISEQANVPGGLMSLDPGTVPGQRPPRFGQHDYPRLSPVNGLLIKDERVTSSAPNTK